MNKELAERCNCPDQFDSIRYAVHFLDTGKMHTTISDILDINPYLAALCYTSSESDAEYKKELIHLVKKYINDSESSELLENSNPTKIVCAVLSLFELDAPLSIQMYALRRLVNGFPYADKKNKRKRIFTSQDDWNSIDDYFVEKLEHCVIKSADSRLISRYYMQLERSSISSHVTMSPETLVEAKRAYEDERWEAFLLLIEMNGLYGQLHTIDPDYLSKVPVCFTDLYLDSQYRFKNTRQKKERYPQAYYQQIVPLKKVLALYILNSNNIRKRIETVRKLLDTLPDPERALASDDVNKYEFLRYALQIRDLYRVLGPDAANQCYKLNCGQEPLSSPHWDSNRNGVRKPFMIYCDAHTPVWWSVTSENHCGTEFCLQPAQGELSEQWKTELHLAKKKRKAAANGDSSPLPGTKGNSLLDSLVFEYGVDDWVSFLLLLEQEALYGELRSADLCKLEKATSSFRVFSRNAVSIYLQHGEGVFDTLCIALQKFLAVYVLFADEERIDRFQSIKSMITSAKMLDPINVPDVYSNKPITSGEIKRAAQKYNSFLRRIQKRYALLDDAGTIDMKYNLNRALPYLWDSAKNGIEKPLMIYCQEETPVWWKLEDDRDSCKMPLHKILSNDMHRNAHVSAKTRNEKSAENKKQQKNSPIESNLTTNTSDGITTINHRIQKGRTTKPSSAISSAKPQEKHQMSFWERMRAIKDVFIKNPIYIDIARKKK